MTNFPRRVLPGKESQFTAVAIWDGPESLVAVLRLNGSGRLSLVQPKDADGKPLPGSARNCLRIANTNKVAVAHPGDLVVTDIAGRLGVIHGHEWAAAHKAYFTQEEN